MPHLTVLTYAKRVSVVIPARPEAKHNRKEQEHKQEWEVKRWKPKSIICDTQTCTNSESFPLTIEKDLTGISWVLACFSVSVPNSPLLMLGHTMHHRSPFPSAAQAIRFRTSVDPNTLCLCLFSGIAPKGLGRRELYLFTMWWHHL